MKSLLKIEPKIIEEIEHFFISYNAARGRRFKPTRRKGPVAAKRLIEAQRGRKRKPRR
jgi:inorganic pyrophosphatase